MIVRLTGTPYHIAFQKDEFATSGTINRVMVYTALKLDTSVQNLSGYSPPFHYQRETG